MHCTVHWHYYNYISKSNLDLTNEEKLLTAKTQKLKLLIFSLVTNYKKISGKQIIIVDSNIIFSKSYSPVKFEVHFYE